MRAVLALPWRQTRADPLRAALRPWAQRLALESIGRWLVRGAIVALTAMSLVLAVGWVMPWPMDELWSVAQQVAPPILIAALVVGAWPSSMLRRAAELDVRLRL